VLAKIFLFLLF